MKIHFNDSEQVVMNVLRDMAWHCLAVELTGKSVDYRARITQKGAIQDKLEAQGYTIVSEPCKFHNHKGNVLMRRIIKVQDRTQSDLLRDNPARLDFFNKYPVRA